jgi:hypothetical protein
MIRSVLIFIFVSFFVVAIGAPASLWSTQSASQVPCADEHREWVGKTLEKMEAINPGMTRENLSRVFTTEGGLSTGLRRTYVSQECPYFKVDVEFKAVGRPDRGEDGRVTLVEDRRDIIVKISRPYLAFGIAD